jgi:hypothetical protein
MYAYYLHTDLSQETSPTENPTNMPMNASDRDIAPKRNRLWYGFCIVLVVTGGLLWRHPWFSLPAAVSKYGGDALWSLFVFLGFGFLLPRSSTRRTAILAILFSFAVETSQLWHAPWIDAVRETRLGALALGSVFHWPDFVAYILGIAIGATAEWVFRRIVRTPCPCSQPTDLHSEREGSPSGRA